MQSLKDGANPDLATCTMMYLPAEQMDQELTITTSLRLKAGPI